MAMPLRQAPPRTASESASGERVANLREQNDFVARRRGRRGGGGSGPVQHVDRLDDEEENEGDDEKIDRDGDEIAVGEDRTLLFRIDEVAGNDFRGEAEEVIGK